jgi:hypothetical protein
MVNVELRTFFAPVQPSGVQHLAIRCSKGYINQFNNIVRDKEKASKNKLAISGYIKNNPSTFEFGFSILGNGINYGKSSSAKQTKLHLKLSRIINDNCSG